jgi:hypothetical protein
MKKREKRKQEKIDLISEHWDDEDFHKIREAFLDYLVCTGYNCGDEYMEELGYLLGISSFSYGGWDITHELSSKESIKYIKI